MITEQPGDWVLNKETYESVDLSNFLEHDKPEIELGRPRLEALTENSRLMNAFESWVQFEDFLSLVENGGVKYTFKSSTSDKGVHFRTFAADLAFDLFLSSGVTELAEEFYAENIDSPITFIKPDDREKAASILDHRLEVIQEQDSRYKERYLRALFPLDYPDKISTLAWSIPFEWNKKILNLFSKVYPA